MGMGVRTEDGGTGWGKGVGTEDRGRRTEDGKGVSSGMGTGGLDCHPGVGDAEDDIVAVFVVVIDIYTTSDLFGCVLQLAVFGCEGTVEVKPGIPDADHGVVVVDQGLDVDAFVLLAVDNRIDHIPKYVGHQVLFCDEAKTLGYAVEDDVVPFHCQGLQTGQEVIDQLVQGYLYPAGRGFKGDDGGFLGRAGDEGDGFHKMIFEVEW